MTPLQAAYAHLDRHLEAVRAQLSCTGRGCSGCCHGIIPVTDLEWTAIRPHITRAQRNLARTVAPEDGHARCPLLGEDGRCTVYAVRPLLCRSFTSTVAPSRCLPWTPLPPVPDAGSRSALRTAHRLAGVNPDAWVALTLWVASLTDEEMEAAG